MARNSLLIVGCGDLGLRLAGLLAPEGWAIGGVRRHPPEAADPGAGVAEWFAADYAEPGSLDFMEQLAPDFIVTTFTPTSMDLQGYRRGFAAGARNVLTGLGRHRPRLSVMVSSTRVYAESDGGWVDESSALTTTDERGLAIVEAERQFLESGHAVSALRCGGIYGAPGGRLLGKIAAGRVAPERPVRYTNRIHRDDCTGFIAHLLERSLSGRSVEPIYNVVDDDPAPAHEVESWIAGQLGCLPSNGAAPESTGAVSHKRCRNDLLHTTGYRLRYPDYRAGYGELCADARGGAPA